MAIKSFKSSLKSTAEFAGYILIIIGIIIIMVMGFLTYSPGGSDPFFLILVYLGGGMFFTGIVLVRTATIKKEPEVPKLDEKDDDEYVF